MDFYDLISDVQNIYNVPETVPNMPEFNQNFNNGIDEYLLKTRIREGKIGNFKVGARTRKAYPKEVTEELEREFQKNSYITRAKRLVLSEKFNMPQTRIKIWFQNRRMKKKKMDARVARNATCSQIISSGEMKNKQTSENINNEPNLQLNYGGLEQTEIASSSSIELFPPTTESTSSSAFFSNNTYYYDENSQQRNREFESCGISSNSVQSNYTQQSQMACNEYGYPEGYPNSSFETYTSSNIYFQSFVPKEFSTPVNVDSNCHRFPATFSNSLMDQLPADRGQYLTPPQLNEIYYANSSPF